MYPLNLQAILVICGISSQIILCSACSHSLTLWLLAAQSSTSPALTELSKWALHITSIKLSPPEHLDWQIFSWDYDTEPKDILEVSGYGAWVVEHKQKCCWVCWVPTEDPERSNLADILSKERTAAKASEMAESTECCVSHLGAEHAPSLSVESSVHRNIESFNRIPQGWGKCEQSCSLPHTVPPPPVTSAQLYTEKIPASLLPKGNSQARLTWTFSIPKSSAVKVL